MNEKFLSIIEKSIKENWDNPALSDYNGETYYYKDFAYKIAELHLLFDILGLEKGEKVALCGRNMANWAVVFFATLSYGAVVTTILHEFNSENIYNIVNHSESKILFAGKHIWDKLDPSQMPYLNTVIQIEDFSIIKSPENESINIWDDRKSLFSNKYPEGFTRESIRFHDESPEELAILNYTSGTTSNPKGVMLPYRSLWSNTRFAIDKIPFVKSGDGIVCMLPMAHMYGLAFEVLLSVSKGCHIHFLTRVPSPQIIIDAFHKVRPPLILAVPLIIEKIIKNKIFPELEKQPVKSFLKIPLLNKLIYKKILNKLCEVFGGNLVEVVIGGAALNQEVGEFLTKIRFPYTVGYGLTECGPLISYEYWETYKQGACGTIVDRMKVKIDSHDPVNVPGEVIAKGMNLMLGYFKNPEETESVLSADGWFKTGDLGTMDKEGHLFLKGRSKTMILGPSGQNIYPEDIEGLLNNYPYVSESLIIEKNGKLFALIFPDHELMKTSNTENENLNGIFEEEIKLLNKRLPVYSQITGFRIQETEFEKTPKRSIRRFLYQE